MTSARSSATVHPRVCVVYLLRTVPGALGASSERVRTGGATPGSDPLDAGVGPSRVQVLLGEKRRGLGAGRLVGPGGKREPGESAVETAVREVREEVGLDLDPADLELRGTLDYRFPYRPSWSQVSDVFVATRWRGEPVSSDELEPRWIDVDAVPYGAMWDDARFWLPGVLAGGRVSARFTFAEDCATVAGFTGEGVVEP